MKRTFKDSILFNTIFEYYNIQKFFDFFENGFIIFAKIIQILFHETKYISLMLLLNLIQIKYVLVKRKINLTEFEGSTSKHFDPDNRSYLRNKAILVHLGI